MLVVYLVMLGGGIALTVAAQSFEGLMHFYLTSNGVLQLIACLLLLTRKEE